MTQRCGLLTTAMALFALAVCPSLADAAVMAVDWGGPNYITNGGGIAGHQRAATVENLTNDYGGAATPDYRKYVPFSDTAGAYFCPVNSPGGYNGYDQSQSSALYYGGYNFIRYDTTGTNYIGVISSSPGDKIQPYVGGAWGTGGEFAETIVWVKDNFLNGANALDNLALDASTPLSITIASSGNVTYRLVVKNGSQYYVSNSTMSATGLFTIADPAAETWAAFNPYNSNNRLSDVSGTFASVTFDDVQALGFYVYKPVLSSAGPSSMVSDVEFQVTTATAVPEPATLGLLAVGGLGLLTASRRRRGA
ncbi:MAG: hypothetical protein BIFFINMI_01088 [Phycisphaerae bacterium]|nr:hypothetical protein [Phycisphaerae bacterium]